MRVRQKQSGNLGGTFAHARFEKTVWQPWRHFRTCAFVKNSLATLAALSHMRVLKKQSGNLGGTFAHARLTKPVWQPWRHFRTCALDKNSLATLAALFTSLGHLWTSLGDFGRRWTSLGDFGYPLVAVNPFDHLNCTTTRLNEPV